MRKLLIPALLLTLAACSPATTQPGTPSPSGNTVSIQNMQFTPNTLTVKAGETVTFVNNDTGASHTATADDKTFDTGIINPGRTAQVTVSKAGNFSYKCNIHPSMTGRLNVQ